MPVGLEYLPVIKEEGQDYRPAQDLSPVNEATVTLHPTVPNPYTLLSLLLLRTKDYTCLDLKDAFFCIHLAPVSQPIFAFEWEDPVGGTKQQLTWLPPKGFKNSPAIFGEALASTWTQSIRKSMDVGSFNTGITCCWLPRPTENVGKGQKHCSSC